MIWLRTVLDPTIAGKDSAALDATLHDMVVGQDEALREIVAVHQMYVAGLCAQGRPIANFLFLGPTGSGKTRTVEALAEALLQNSRAVIKIDCAEFRNHHEIAKLIGSPPGYVGHAETHALLTQEAIDQYHTQEIKIGIILFDEIEKASDSLWNLLLGILDKATLTLGNNRKVDFSRAMIFMTSNLGANEMAALVSPKMGFNTMFNNSGQDLNDEQMEKKISRSGVDAARRKFTPEFMNRIDKVVVFKPLGQNALRRILDLELRQVQQRIVLSPSGKTFVFTVSETGKTFLLSEGTDLKSGARHLKRSIEQFLVHPLSNLMATCQVNAGDCINADFDAEHGCFLFTKEAEGLEVDAMSTMMAENFRTPALAAVMSSQPDLPKAVSAKEAK